MKKILIILMLLINFSSYSQIKFFKSDVKKYVTIGNEKCKNMEYDSAFYYYRLAHENYNKLEYRSYDDIFYIGFSAKKIALIYFEQENYNDAVIWFSTAYTFNESIRDTLEMLSCLKLKADSYYMAKSYDLAKKEYLFTLDVASNYYPVKATTTQTQIFHILARMEYMKNDIDSAIYYLKEIVDSYENISTILDPIYCYFLADLYLKKGNQNEARKYFELCIELKMNSDVYDDVIYHASEKLCNINSSCELYGMIKIERLKDKTPILPVEWEHFSR